MLKFSRVLFRLIAAFILLLTAVYLIWAMSPVPKRAGLVPGDYFEARRRFLANADRAGASIESYEIAAKGPGGEPLFIDVARLGSNKPQRVLLHISGTHGVEGFAGSAIQTAILTNPPPIPESAAIIFLYALNPWGMAHYRRFNENNVDLNRNFLLDSDKFKGAPDAYRKAEWFLNPRGKPKLIDAFVPESLFLLSRFGFTTLKQAIAGGQYEFPQGIYYGGSRLEESSQFLIDWVKRNLVATKVTAVIEIHTGLGDFDGDTLFWPIPAADIRTRLLSKYLGEKFESDAPDEGVGFKTPGDLQNEVPKLLPEVRFGWTLQEFGAYGPVATLRALRNENRHHFYGDRSIGHWSKKELLEAFSPGSEAWQRRVIERGVALAAKFASILSPEVTREHIEQQVGFSAEATGAK